MRLPTGVGFAVSFPVLTSRSSSHDGVCMKQRIQSTRPTDARSLGSQIREAREHLEMSQQQLAALVSLTDAQISRLERGRNTTDAERLVLIARELGLDAAEVLRRSGYRVLAEELSRRQRPRRSAPAPIVRDIEELQRSLSKLHSSMRRG